MNGGIMSYSELSGEEKKQIVRSQIKNIQYNRYIADLSILQEQGLSDPNSLIILSCEAELAKYDIKEGILTSKLQELLLEYPDIEEVV
jgi:hypothetical protein